MNAIRGAIRPPPADDMRVTAQAAEHRRTAAFWSHFEANVSNPNRWVDSAAAYWRPAAEVIAS
ncbi:hypothetical protein PX701_10065 [Agromyces sp. H3Y2-19a]|uniref:hypothetical protein n=1 Tax=Agromyces TaxID=33877 RepID=UPI001E35722B|nr:MULTISPECIES: hypothetical protein [Agromyces]MCD5344854.1 hypothetical protein [Agromyces sp. S2-1-8]MDF0513963.1 hypothetical protein [Agromyces chromiiresistens]